jgi:hypothetical protein
MCSLFFLIDGKKNKKDVIIQGSTMLFGAGIAGNQILKSDSNYDNVDSYEKNKNILIKKIIGYYDEQIRIINTNQYLTDHYRKNIIDIISIYSDHVLSIIKQDKNLLEAEKIFEEYKKPLKQNIYDLSVSSELDKYILNIIKQSKNQNDFIDKAKVVCNKIEKNIQKNLLQEEIIIQYDSDFYKNKYKQALQDYYEEIINVNGQYEKLKDQEVNIKNSKIIDNLQHSKKHFLELTKDNQENNLLYKVVENLEIHAI